MEVVKFRSKMSFCQIFDYMGNRKRRLIEGEEVLKAGYMVVCGINEEKAKCVVAHPFVFRRAAYEENHIKLRHMSRKMNSLRLAAAKRACLATVSTALLCLSVCTCTSEHFLLNTGHKHDLK